MFLAIIDPNVAPQVIWIGQHDIIDSIFLLQAYHEHYFDFAKSWFSWQVWRNESVRIQIWHLSDLRITISHRPWFENMTQIKEVSCDHCFWKCVESWKQLHSALYRLNKFGWHNNLLYHKHCPKIKLTTHCIGAVFVVFFWTTAVSHCLYLQPFSHKVNADLFVAKLCKYNAK